MTESAPLIAVLNSSSEVIRILRETLEADGFRTVGYHVGSAQSGEETAEAFFARYRPRVAIYDISIPYDRNWQVFLDFATSEAANGCRFVLTTTNKRALEEIVGPTGALEIIGKPFDLEEVVRAVRRALEGSEPRPASR
ncbi:MAG: hypothetical protein K6U89_09320 [Chloroflexi bacterium]|nr:hypothetical protein [Chloroflexota bacterium]